jgi:hypothetical protein
MHSIKAYLLGYILPTGIGCELGLLISLLALVIKLFRSNF